MKTLEEFMQAAAGDLQEEPGQDSHGPILDVFVTVDDVPACVSLRVFYPLDIYDMEEDYIESENFDAFAVCTYIEEHIDEC